MGAPEPESTAGLIESLSNACRSVSTPYNPLDRVNLARSVELTLMQQPCHELPLTDRFDGAGLYALYYQGDFELYEPISRADCSGPPIYVGKADRPGGRKGLIDPSTTSHELFNRIANHTASIEAAGNLDVRDFRCRYLVVADMFIELAEQLLIQQFKPLWNIHVDGFGMKTPGKRRYGGNRSEWDELHPGRAWHQHMRQIKTADDIAKKVREAFEERDTATTEALPEGAIEEAEAEGAEAPETEQ